MREAKCLKKRHDLVDSTGSVGEGTEAVEDFQPTVCEHDVEAFNDFMLSLTQDQCKMLSIVLYENFQTKQNINKMDADRENLLI